MRAIEQSVAYAQYHAVIAALGAVASVVLWWSRRRSVHEVLALVAVLLLVLHPAWTVSAIQGDCGHLKRAAATGVTIAVAACVATQIAVLLLARRRPHDS
jgi:hypothetical protein